MCISKTTDVCYHIVLTLLPELWNGCLTALLPALAISDFLVKKKNVLETWHIT